MNLMDRTNHPVETYISVQLSHVHWGKDASKTSEKSPIAPYGYACEDACIVDLSDTNVPDLHLAWWDVGAMRPFYSRFKPASGNAFELTNDGPTNGLVVRFFGWDDDVAASRQAIHKEAVEDGFVVPPDRMGAWCDRRRVLSEWIPNTGL